MLPDGKFDLLLFDYKTVNLTDFRNGEILPIVKTNYKPPARCLYVRGPPLKDPHTFTNWKNDIKAPITTFYRPKPITGTDPQKIQQPCSAKRRGDEYLEACRTRPRLVMTPAATIDDVTDPNILTTLRNYMYETNQHRAMKDGIKNLRIATKKQAQQLQHQYSLVLPPFKEVSITLPEWRVEALDWDSRQRRTYCDTIKNFWLKKKHA